MKKCVYVSHTNDCEYSWNIAGWAPYLIVAIAMGLAGHRFKLPMTFRACFYPMLGEYTWGWIGDIIDGFTIVVTVAGVCTSLGLGAMQIIDGFVYLGWVERSENGGGSLEVSSELFLSLSVSLASFVFRSEFGNLVRDRHCHSFCHIWIGCRDQVLVAFGIQSRSLASIPRVRDGRHEVYYEFDCAR